MGFRRSFGAKLLTFAALLVLGVVGFITLKNSLFLRDTLNRQYQSSLIDATQLLGERVSNHLVRWDTKLGFLVQALLQAREQDRLGLVEAFLRGEEALQALELIEMQAESRVLVRSPQDFSLVTHDRIQKALKDREVSILPHPKDKGLAILLRRVVVKDAERRLIVAIAFKVSALSPRVGRDAGTEVYLLDARFQDLLTREAYTSFLPQKGFLKKLKSVVSSDIGSGYLGEITRGQERLLVAYHQLQPYPLLLIVHQDLAMVTKAIRAFIVEILQWTLLFVLIAVLVAQWMVRNLLVDLRELARATLRIGAGQFKQVVQVRSQDEIGQLAHSFNAMSRKIVALLAAEHEKARLEQELTMAQTVQNTFFKEQSVQRRDIAISSFYKPASECGGDWWGHFTLNDGIELVLIGDATGHGVPAALVTAIAYATAHTLVEQMRVEESAYEDPSQILRSLNSLLNRTLRGTLCMSFCALLVDVRRGRLIYSNGGHPFPVLIPKNPKDQRLGEAAKRFPFRFLLQKKKSTGILGIDPATQFFNDEIELSPGDKILIYTDGLTEAEDKNGKQWGNRGLQRHLQQNASKSAVELQHALLDEVIQFNAQKDQFADDLTVVIIEYRTSAVEAA